MPTKVGQLPEKDLESKVKEIEKNLVQLKATQLQSGRGGMLGYETKTEDEWDDIVTQDSGSKFILQTFQYVIDFTGSDVSKSSLESLYIDLYLNSPIPENKIQAGSAWEAYKEDSNGILMLDPLVYQTYTTPFPGQTTLLYNEKKHRWICYIYIGGLVTFYVKFRAYGTDLGTLTFTRGFYG